MEKKYTWKRNKDNNIQHKYTLIDSSGDTLLEFYRL